MSHYFDDVSDMQMRRSKSVHCHRRCRASCVEAQQSCRTATAPIWTATASSSLATTARYDWTPERPCSEPRFMLCKEQCLGWYYWSTKCKHGHAVAVGLSSSAESWFQHDADPSCAPCLVLQCRHLHSAVVVRSAYPRRGCCALRGLVGITWTQQHMQSVARAKPALPWCANYLFLCFASGLSISQSLLTANLSA